jgi:hypothetical protein
VIKALQNAPFYRHLGMSYNKNSDRGRVKDSVNRAMTLHSNYHQALEIKGLTGNKPTWF